MMGLPGLDLKCPDLRGLPPVRSGERLAFLARFAADEPKLLEILERLDPGLDPAEPFGLSLTFTYDEAGNRTKVQDSLGGVATSTYGAAIQPLPGQRASLAPAPTPMSGSAPAPGVGYSE